MSEAFIYVLKDPITLEVRYVGKAVNVDKRLASHLRDSRRRDTPVYRWIRSIGVPVVEVIEGPVKDWIEAERRLIASLKQDGCDLLNVAIGGDQPHCPLAVRQANARFVARARVSTPNKKRLYELKRSLGHLLRAGVVSDETKTKMGMLARRRPDLFPKWVNL